MKYQRLAMCDKRLRRYIPSESDHQIHSEFTFIELCPKTQRYIYIYIHMLSSLSYLFMNMIIDLLESDIKKRKDHNSN